jgi:hypothetical protein|tara:strand:+ start:1982 stop:2170 length:189 start_codon:yes stop_codon:yes gene_type:complete
MSITLEEMSEGYIQSIKYRIERSQQDLQELVQHLQECENTLQFETSNNKKCSEGKCEEKKVK